MPKAELHDNMSHSFSNLNKNSISLIEDSALHKRHFSSEMEDIHIWYKVKLTGQKGQKVRSCHTTFGIHVR